MPSELAHLEAQAPRLREFLQAYNPGHDATQIRHFIVGEQPTAFGRYKQAIAECWNYYTAARQSMFEQRKAEARKRILQAEIDALEAAPTPRDAAEADLKRIEIEELDFALEGHAKALARAINELGQFYGLALENEAQIAGRKHEELEAEYWHVKLAGAPILARLEGYRAGEA
jgi:hypothetical protein